MKKGEQVGEGDQQERKTTLSTFIKKQSKVRVRQPSDIETILTPKTVVVEE